MQTNPESAAVEAVAWRCFYCDEVFTDRESAHLHFGAGNFLDQKTPGCQIDIATYRAMEETVRRYQEEDADIHRAMHRMAGEHALALRREEEKGYARGLNDSGQCPCDSATQHKSALDALRGEVDRLRAEVESERKLRLRAEGLCSAWITRHDFALESLNELTADRNAQRERADAAERRVVELERVCAEAYQVVGVLLSDTDQFDTDHGEKILDNLSEARIVHEDVLPWESKEARHG